MVGISDRSETFGKIGKVSYLQGYNRGRELRGILGDHPWIKTECVRVGSKWEWVTCIEGYPIGSGSASSESKALRDAEGKRMDFFGNAR